MKLQQALHGYADGHTLLASSLQLKSRDARTMLVLSDISGPGTRIEEAGYLTGYALPESGTYALARTWAAPEMPRPGCVWTHTLLIDFADLATTDSLLPLLSLFRRPMPGTFSTYGAPVTFNADDMPPAGLSPGAAHWTRALLAALYGAPQSRVVATAPREIDVERTLIALWEQQWPRLRRTLRFCTLSGTDRSNDAGVFDLQLIDGDDRAARTRFPGAIEASQIASATWLDDALTDLMEPNSAGLRAFFHRVGGEVVGGREVFVPLCRLSRLLNNSEASIDDAIAILETELTKTPSRAASALVVNAALPNLKYLSETSFHFVLRHLDLADKTTLAQHETEIGIAIGRRAPDVLALMLRGDEASRRIATAGLTALSVREIADVIRANPEVLDYAVNLNPRLLAEPALWATGLGIDAELMGVDGDLATDAITAMILAGRSDLVASTTSKFGTRTILEALALLGSTGSAADVTPWAIAAARDQSAVAAHLAGTTATPLRTLILLARVSTPDSAPSSGGDPWLAAFPRADGAVDPPDQLYLCGFLLSRALGWRSSDSAALAQVSFDPIYEAASAGRLPADAWRLLDQRLPWPTLWYDWDHCARLRVGLVNLFVDRELSANVFAGITRDDRLFLSLAETTAGTHRGRRFLKSVLKALKSSPESSLASRIPIVEALLGS